MWKVVSPILDRSPYIPLTVGKEKLFTWIYNSQGLQHYYIPALQVMEVSSDGL